MLRARRYRVFLLIAALSALTFYHLKNVRDWDASATFRPDSLTKTGGDGQEKGNTTPPKEAPQKIPPEIGNKQETTTSTTLSRISSTAVSSLDGLSSPTSSISTSSTTTSTLEDIAAPKTASSSSKATADPAKTNDEKADGVKEDEQNAEFGQKGRGRLEANPSKSGLPWPTWVRQKEHFPVPTESLITLPSGKPKTIPRIQFSFPEESEAEKVEREHKLEAIRQAFEHAWSGYKANAMFHDELTPVSGEYKDPFNGWGATLVDTLDTLWIMGLKDEFEKAAQWVKKINFTTSGRKDIPLFETVIRYLGGLIAAYDISNAKYPVFLDKAVELADVLMGSFDTPNRMPVTFYYWAPSYASQPHRASTRVVMAELGSLSVEFTRLAQITKEDKYYDAIARITDELEKWQSKTKIPGLWPVHVDASGCQKPDMSSAQVAHSNSKGPQKNLPVISNDGKVSSSAQDPDQPSKLSPALRKRQLDDSDLADDEEPAVPPGNSDVQLEAKQALKKQAIASEADQEAALDVDCKPQGLASPPYSTMETFQIGGQADSTFEYLPKEYMLLGGLNDQYRTMYEDSASAIKKSLLFRPMIEDEDRDLLFAAKVTTSGKKQKHSDNEEATYTRKDPDVVYEGTHLTCFAGGMFAVGAKIFNIEEDMEIASKLTDGCVWAYEATHTGVMPETFEVLPCEDKTKCPFNQTAWYEALDPYRKSREESIMQWNENQKLLEEQRLAELKGKKTSVKSDGSGSASGPDGSTSSADSAMRSAKQSSPANDPETSESDGDSKPVADTADSSRSEKLSKRQVGRTRIAYEDENTARKIGSPDTRKEAVKGGPTKTKILHVSDYDNEDADGPQKPAPATAPKPSIDIEEESIAPVFTPVAIPDHEEYVKTKIEEDRLPTGVTFIGSRHYILRPEAIESVFIMYRITGDKYWREKGWKMFNAIERNTRTEFGNSAIRDVTKTIPAFEDSMESFWLAETLKYFYLLYSDPSLVSLDDYVLNTEAHPFQRPS